MLFRHIAERERMLTERFVCLRLLGGCIGGVGVVSIRRVRHGRTSLSSTFLHKFYEYKVGQNSLLALTNLFSNWHFLWRNK